MINIQRMQVHLAAEASLWKLQFAHSLHNQSLKVLNEFTEYIRETTKAMDREVVELEDLSFGESTLHSL